MKYLSVTEIVAVDLLCLIKISMVYIFSSYIVRYMLPSQSVWIIPVSNCCVLRYLAASESVYKNVSPLIGNVSAIQPRLIYWWNCVGFVTKLCIKNLRSGWFINCACMVFWFYALFHLINLYGPFIFLFLLRHSNFLSCRCEAFPTYPRTYDMVHAEGLLSLLTVQQRRCTLLDLFSEIDRVLRPEVQ